MVVDLYEIMALLNEGKVPAASKVEKMCSKLTYLETSLNTARGMMKKYGLVGVGLQSLERDRTLFTKNMETVSLYQSALVNTHKTVIIVRFLILLYMLNLHCSTET